MSRVRVMALEILAVAVAVAGSAWWVSAQPSSAPPSAETPILQCYQDGAVLVAAPVPAPEDFRAQLGVVTHATWTLPTGARQVLASTADCVYLVSQPPPGSAPANE